MTAYLDWLRATASAPYLLEWLLAFAITQAVEIPIYVWAFPGERWPWRALKAFGASAITHPFVWFLFPFLLPGHARYLTMVVVAESFAVGVEAVYLRLLGAGRALAWAMVANGASFSVGVLHYWLRGMY
jgi:hypothetical protein